jgi:hypothetical protein
MDMDYDNLEIQLETELNALLSSLTPQARVLPGYETTPKGAVSGKFRSGGRLFDFIVSSNGVSYKPTGRNDTKRCTNIGYNCGNTCLSLHKTCHKGTAALDRQRLNKILGLAASLSQGNRDKRRGMPPNALELDKLYRELVLKKRAQKASQEPSKTPKKKS